MNARRTDSLAARLQALANQSDDVSIGEFLAFVSSGVSRHDPGSSIPMIETAIGGLQSAINLIEADLADSEQGKPKAARKKKAKL